MVTEENGSHYYKLSFIYEYKLNYVHLNICVCETTQLAA